VVTSQGTFRARSVVLATGGLALPKSGSDGAGYTFARALGHSIVPTTPALVPLVFDADPAHDWMRAITGVAHETRLTVRRDQAQAAAVRGAMLWTHFGVSGPAVLDISRHWLRDRLEGHHPGLAAALLPDHRFDTLEPWWLERTRRSPKSSVSTTLADLLPASVGAAVAGHAGLSGTLLADLPRESRRRLIHLLLDCPLPVTGSRGYTYAEVTAGGIPLTEIDPATMESRLVPGLYLVGEILDVDGRLGGFNFQWAWASAKVAGDALRFTLTA
jgi:predicted Rossmann fold flavoprotein